MHLFEAIIGAFEIYIHKFFEEDAEIILLGNQNMGEKFPFSFQSL